MIKSFDELITFVKEHDLTGEQMADLSGKGLKIYFTESNYNKGQFIECLTEFWEKWKDNPEKPLFADFDNPLQ